MLKVIAFVRGEVVAVAGVVTAALDFVVTHGNVLAAIVPIVASFGARSQVSPVVRVQELVRLVASLKAAQSAPVPPLEGVKS